jgi:Na+-transporting NADH:ubiquinone oxidoreductase subunit NqrB
MFIDPLISLSIFTPQLSHLNTLLVKVPDFTTSQQAHVLDVYDSSTMMILVFVSMALVFSL